MDIHKILKHYWGYDAFRSMQEEIIRSVLEGKDTLALLPTGGGKSICFQVPAMAMEGMCIVVSPLIALMKDQVENLKQKNIPAEAIYTGLSFKEIESILRRCEQGELKFLYLSPERLKTELLQNIVQKMNVSLLAIDESHCISQWGYDFRPPYLEIADFRQLLPPQTPVLALTATATPEVVLDIQQKLKFRKNNVFQKSFARPNLTYFVFKEENKIKRLLQIINKIEGTGIVYVRSRKKTVEMAKLLNQHGISADFYHAGLDMASREYKQEAWKNNKTRIIVATNAFGMGIDKPDVRVVIHIDIPDNLEAYFQEAGRAGRDEKPAYAVLLYENADLVDLEKNYQNSFPPIPTIVQVYDNLCSYFQIPAGEGEGKIFDFDMLQFAQNVQMSPLLVHYALVFLQQSGLLAIEDNAAESSKVNILLNNKELDSFLEKHQQYEDFVKLLLRSYSGLFSSYVAINEEVLSQRSEQPIEKIKQILHKLAVFKVIAYYPQTNMPKLVFLSARPSSNHLPVNQEYYKTRKKVAQKRLAAVFNYVQSTNKCRSRLLLEYFGEKNSNNCEHCDACLQMRADYIPENIYENIENHIFKCLQDGDWSLEELLKKIPQKSDLIISVLRDLLSKETISLTKEKKYQKK